MSIDPLSRSGPVRIIFLFVILQVEFATSQDVRLIPGPDKGRLEVRYDGAWGTVCDRNFKNQAASVVCRSLGQPSNNSYWVYGQKFGTGSLKPRLTLVSCSGKESAILDCSLTPAEDPNKPCSSTSYVVGIVCTNEKMRALTRYGNKWFDTAQQINVFKQDYILCYAGNDSQVKDFQCTLRAGTYYTSGSCARTYRLPSYTGELTCSVSNWQVKNQDTLTVEINTMYPPDAIVTSYIKVFEHTSVNITLRNLPNPLPYLTNWRQTGRKLKWNQTEAYRAYKNISRTDGGEFLVNISNQMNSSSGVSRQGNGVELLFVDVLYKPKVQCRQEYIVDEGSNVNITCSTDANPSPHVYIWTDSSGNNVAEGREPSFAIDSVGPQDTGQYKCTAVSTMTDSAGVTKSGIGFAELTIKLVDSSPIKPPNQQTVQPPLSSVAYVMIAVAVISLVVILILSVVICRLKKTRDVPSAANMSRGTTGRGERATYQNQGLSEEDYTTLDFVNRTRK